MQKIYISHLRNIFLCRKCLLQIKYKSFSNIYSFCKKKKFFDHKKKSLKLRCELNNLVLKFSEASNMWYSLN